MESLIVELVDVLEKFKDMGFIYSISFDHDIERVEYTNEDNIPQIATIIKGQDINIYLHKDIHSA